MGDWVADLAIYRRLLGVQLRSQLQYPVAFAFDVLGTAVITVIEFGAFALVMLRFETIGGWTLAEVAFLYGMVEAAFGVMDMVFSGFDPRDFGQAVRRGSFDQVLLRPVGATLQVLGSRLEIRRVGRLGLSVAIFGAGVYLNDVHWTAVKLAYLPLVFASIVAFFGGLFMIGSTITFWTVESIEVVNILTYGGKELISYPMHIYPLWMRRFFTFIVPAMFLNYYPALYVLAKPDPLGLAPIGTALAPVAGFGMLAVALGAWRFGIRHYQSTGT